MAHTLILTVCAADRPGIMSRISSIIQDGGGNWLESRMARLGGQFAGIVRVSCENEPSADALQKVFEGILSEGIQVDCHVEGQIQEIPFSRCLQVDIHGNDRPGIVSQLTRAISQAGANVEELNTSIESAAMAGHSIFHVSGRICLPEKTSNDEILEIIENLSDDLNVEVTSVS